MPELPEVETVRRIVERELVGKRLITYELRLAKLLRDSPLPSLDTLVDRTVIAAHRRAKVLVIDFDGALSVMMHFKLAGQLVVVHHDGARSWAGHPIPDPRGPLPHRTTHLTLFFDDGIVAHYSDIRQFGWIRVLSSDDVAPTLDRFGFGPEGTGASPLSVDDLAAKLRRRSIPIKAALLDQTVVAGLGNIYVDEALFTAQIHPARPANSLVAGEINVLTSAIPESLDLGIAQGGATIIHQRAFPVDGFPRVHAREGEPCGVCGTSIVKTRVATRGTYYCPLCQPEPIGWVRVPAGMRQSRLARAPKVVVDEAD